MSSSRREFLQSTAFMAAPVIPAGTASPFHDGPATPRFSPVTLAGNTGFEDLAGALASRRMQAALAQAPRAKCISWGIPFDIGRPILLKNQPAVEKVHDLKAEWLVFLHTADLSRLEADAHGLVRPMRGEGQLGEHIADYTVVYADGSEARTEIRRRHHIGSFRRRWGENCFQAVAHRKPHSLRAFREQPSMPIDAGGSLRWGSAETRVSARDRGAWVNWLWAWQNPNPSKAIAEIRFTPKSGIIIVSAVSAGRATDHPLRWQTRRKAILTLPEGVTFDFKMDGQGRWNQVQIDMGQIISVESRKSYPNQRWELTYNNEAPELMTREVLIEYSAHPDACFHFPDGSKAFVSALATRTGNLRVTPIEPATQRVRICAIDPSSGKPVSAKLHVHGEHGEYLTPVDRHRYPNNAWFEDYAPEFQSRDLHCATYISGETLVDLPVGTVYIEVSKGFENRPVRKAVRIDRSTEAITLEIEKLLPWRERGWVTADTHVHFLSPPTAQLEGSAEGVNVINLLASQWGELMTNVGDFDGKTTFGSREAGGTGEWLVRVGTENRQRVLGHISLLGYKGGIIAPMCAGGPDEAAIGDPVSALLMEWAERCHAQGGLVVLPHFPDPRCESTAALISGLIDGVEMTSESYLYGGIDPYSLSDYYRYLNCGYFVACVGGTDKMAATTPVGAVRTYARIPAGTEFTYETWLEAVRSGHTFATYGPLMEFTVNGRAPGSRMTIPRTGGTLDVAWELASVTLPMTKVELVVNGEIRESRSVKPDRDSGHWSFRVDRSSWLGLMVRGHYPGKPEIIAAHSSPVMVGMEGSRFFSQLDAVTMLEQIEGALAYVDTIGTRAEDKVYKRIRLKLMSVYRTLHNKLHEEGHFHEHTPITAHS